MRSRFTTVVLSVLATSLVGEMCGQQPDFIQWAKLPLPPARKTALQNALVTGDGRRFEQLLMDEIQANPKSPALLSSLGAFYFESGRYFEAAVAYKKADFIVPLDETSRFKLATAYIALDRRHWARPELERLLADHPGKALYPYWLAIVYMDFQWFDRAVAQLQKAIELDPRFIQAYQRLGLSFQNLGNFDEAVQAYRRGVLLNREDQRGSPWPALFLGRMLRKLGQLEDAEKSVREAIANDSRLAEAHHELGLILQGLGRHREAIERLTEGVSWDPDDPKLYYALAESYRRLGEKHNLMRALENFRRLSAAERPAARP